MCTVKTTWTLKHTIYKLNCISEASSLVNTEKKSLNTIITRNGDLYHGPKSTKRHGTKAIF